MTDQAPPSRGSSQHLGSRLFALELTVWGQRSLRLLLRAAWLGLGGYLIAHSLAVYWDWLSDPLIWLGVGIAFALLPLARIFLSWPARRKLVWSLDRRLGLNEQISTAWQVAVENEPDPIAVGLVADAQGILPQAHRRVLRRGWFLERDLVSLALVVVLWVSMNFAGAQISYLPAEAGAVERLPALGQDARARAVFPDALSKLAPQQDENGQQPAPGGGQGKQPGAGQGPSEGQNSAGDPEQMLNALSQLGSKLSQQAATYELGQALQNADLGKAASETENLADQADSLSKETRQQLAEAMREAAEQLDPFMPEDSPLPEDLRSTADSLAPPEPAQPGAPGAQPTSSNPSSGQGSEPSGEDPGGQSAGDQLDQLAGDLRELEGQMPPGMSGMGASSAASTGDLLPEPAARLQGGSDQDFHIQVTAEPSGLLSPANPEQSGEALAAGPMDALQAGSQEVVQNIVHPISYSWNWLYTVAAYFQR